MEKPSLNDGETSSDEELVGAAAPDEDPVFGSDLEDDETLFFDSAPNDLPDGAPTFGGAKGEESDEPLLLDLDAVDATDGLLAPGSPGDEGDDAQRPASDPAHDGAEVSASDLEIDDEPELIDDDDLLEVLDGPGVVVSAEAEDVEAVRRELEERLADTRGQLGARIAELEGELEALREERAEWTRELDELEAELVQRGTALAETRASVDQLREAMAELDQERIRLVSQVAHLQHDRERIQDDLAAQIAQIAGDLAARDQEVARLAAELEDLRGENEFLSSELDRYAAQAMGRQPT